MRPTASRIDPDRQESCCFRLARGETAAPIKLPRLQARRSFPQTNPPARETACSGRSRLSTRRRVQRTGPSEALAAKNRLTASDAKLLEDAFEQTLSQFMASESAEVSTGES